MSAAGKRKGSLYESQLESWLIQSGYDATRLARAGSKDVGDLHVRLNDGTYLVIEAKARKTMALREWIKESQVESVHHEEKYKAESYGVVVHKARQQPISDSYVTMTLTDFMELLRLKGVV